MDETFPDDANGDTLRRMRRNGDDLSQPREVDFSIIFPHESFAIDFIRVVEAKFDKVRYEKADHESDLPWDVTATRFMTPSYEEISATEVFLESVAEKFGGEIDGWGCFSVRIDACPN